MELESGIYADNTADIKQEDVTWNHSLSEVINRLIKNGLEINYLTSTTTHHTIVLTRLLNLNQKKYGIEYLENKIPMVYSILAKKINNS